MIDFEPKKFETRLFTNLEFFYAVFHNPFGSILFTQKR